MARYHLTKLAVDDLSDIWNYTFETWSEKQADRYYDFLLKACQELANNPKIGKKYEIVANGILGYKAGDHIVFYRCVSKNEIEVIRILYGMMDLKSRI